MKNTIGFVAISFFFGAFGSSTFAQHLEAQDLKSRIFSCQAVNSQIPSGLITLTDSKHMTEFKVGSQVVWAVNLETETSTVDTIKIKDLNPAQFPLIKSMLNLAANKKAKQIQSIKLSMVSKKTGFEANESLPERIERVSGEATGYIYLEALNSKNKVIGNSAMASWAGLFKNCQ